MFPVRTTELSFSDEAKNLIKATVAKGATEAELQLFLYRCQKLGLDPLKPGQVHFVKYGTNPGSIVVGIDGFRSQAAKTGKHVGTKRGVLRDKEGRCIGAWCEVFRSDWKEPAREEVPISEYNTGKAMWLKMPETMIKKVAEAAALRMAFPDELGGLYSHEELDQASRDASPEKANQINTLLSEPDEPDFITEAASDLPEDPGDYIIPIGQKYKGKRLADISPSSLLGFVNWVKDNIQNKNDDTVEFIARAEAFLEVK